MELQEFVDLLNEGKLELAPRPPMDIAKQFAKEVGRSFLGAFRNIPRNNMGLSQVGKPGCVLALYKLRPPKRKMAKITDVHLIFGEYIESLLLNLAIEAGVPVENRQKEVLFCGIKGHIDGIIDGMLCDVKTFHDYNYQSFVNDPHNDDGYLTQIDCYSEALGLDTSCFLCYNKWFPHLSLVHIKKSPARVEAAEDKIIKLEKVRNVTSIVSMFPAPPPKEEYVRGVATGRFLVPNTMRYTGMAHVFYALKKSGYKEYVTDVYSGERLRENIEEYLQC